MPNIGGNGALVLVISGYIWFPEVCAIANVRAMDSQPYPVVGSVEAAYLTLLGPLKFLLYRDLLFTLYSVAKACWNSNWIEASSDTKILKAPIYRLVPFSQYIQIHLKYFYLHMYVYIMVMQAEWAKELLNKFFCFCFCFFNSFFYDYAGRVGERIAEQVRRGARGYSQWSHRWPAAGLGLRV